MKVFNTEFYNSTTQIYFCWVVGAAGRRAEGEGRNVLSVKFVFSLAAAS